MRYPPAIWYPTNKHGYANDDTLRKEGIVAHSMEGSLAAAFGELDKPSRQASWHFSVAKSGDVFQHIDTDNISYASGSYDANKRFWSIEHEGFAGEPLTAAQTEASADLMRWLLSLAGLPALRRQTLWEHNEMTAYGAAPTACPSDRIPWTEIIAEIKGGGDMPLTADERALLQAAKDAAAGAQHEANVAVGRVDTLTNIMLSELAAIKAKITQSGASAEAIAAELAERLKE